MDKINILGVNISTFNKKEIIAKIDSFLADGGQHQIVTPNPEFILEAHKNEEFFYILNKSDLAVPDGIGLKFAVWSMGKNIKRYAGADLVDNLLKLARKKNLKVLIINWSGGLSSADDINNAVNKRYAGVKYKVINTDREGEGIDFQEINKFGPDILLVALGAPWQEKFIYHNLTKMPSIKIGMGVGGSFDFLTGRIKRAPKLMRAMGLEWLWRLAKQPSRIKRIKAAVISFPLKFLKWRFILPFMYRPNVVCMLYKKTNGNYKILLVERTNDTNHWQMPQGGTDGEDIKIAGERELREELDTGKFRIRVVFRNLHKYKFGSRDSETKCVADEKRKRTGYRGQKQGLVIAEFTGRDSDIKINFWDHSDWKWVEADNLISEVHATRQKPAGIYLEKFKEMVNSL